jgi:hypothetical protein
MANKRSLKKEINEKIYGIIDDCFSAEIENQEKNGKDADHDGMMGWMESLRSSCE